MRSRFVVLVTALALAVPALAQEADQTSAATLAELRAEAQRLTTLAQVPEAGRAGAEELLARIDALQESARAQEIARLQAYIAALRSGDSPSVAEEVASSAVSAGAVELAREREALQADVAAFVETYPDAAAVLRRAALAARAGELLGEGWLGSGPFGAAHEAAGMRGRIIRVGPGLGRDGNGRAGGFTLTLPYGFEPPRLFSPQQDDQ